jgi:hypothetical protein
MQIQKATIVIQEDACAICEMDVIEYQGEPWLVPEWLQNTEEGWMTPVRIIRMRGLQFQRRGSGLGYLVNAPVPKAVFDGNPSPEEGRYEIVERPDIRISTGGGAVAISYLGFRFPSLLSL